MLEYKSNYPLSELTTFHIGGPASFFVEVTNENELKEALDFANSKKKSVMAIGGGSNLLISDKGFDGLVIRNKIKELVVNDSGEVMVGAGENWDDVVGVTVEKDLSGIEALSGVPGSAGGAIVQNIGAYGQTIGDLAKEVHAINTETGEEKIFSANQCEFVYRNSFFKQNPGKYIVTRFTFKLVPGGEATITYRDVKKHFEGRPQPTLSEVRQFIIRLRASKGYLIMPGYESYNTAGSFFKNPMVSQKQYEKLKPMLGDITLNRFWETPKGIKVAAAYLMQEAGFGKGYKEGNVGISPKHSLSIVNFGGATANEVIAFADKIKKVVLEKFGVALEEEVLLT